MKATSRAQAWEMVYSAYAIIAGILANYYPNSSLYERYNLCDAE